MTKYQQSSHQDIRNWAKKKGKNENPNKSEIWKVSTQQKRTPNKNMKEKNVKKK